MNNLIDQHKAELVDLEGVNGALRNSVKEAEAKASTNNAVSPNLDTISEDWADASDVNSVKTKPAEVSDNSPPKKKICRTVRNGLRCDRDACDAVHPVFCQLQQCWESVASTGKYTDGCPCFHTHLQRMRRVALKGDRKRNSGNQPPAKSGQKPSGQTTMEARPQQHQRRKHQRQQSKPPQQEQQQQRQRRKPRKLQQAQSPQPQHQQQPQPHRPVSYAASAVANPNTSAASPTPVFSVDAATIMELLGMLQQRQQQWHQPAPPVQPLQPHQPLHVPQPSWLGTQAQAAY